MVDRSTTAVEVLLSPQGCAVLAGGHAGKIVLLVRTALGWTQTELGNRSGWSQSTISRIEEGKTRAVQDMQVLADLAQALGIPPVVLGVAGQAGQAPILDGMDRRGVLGGAVTLVVTMLPHGIATASQIDPDDVAQSWTALHRLQELEWHQGGAAVYQVADEMAQRLQDALRNGSYSAETGRELQRVTVATMNRAGWSAYDAGWGQQARHWWLEASHLADLVDDVPQGKVSALAAMALQTGERPGGGPEAVELAQAAATAAVKETATPSLLSLLAAREAIGHAQAGDASAAVFAIAQARHWLDQGRTPDEPFSLAFYGPADLAWHETQVGLLTRNGRAAENAARTAVDRVDATSFPRNHILYTVRFGNVLTHLGQLDEAISVTRTAIQGVHAVRGSGRIVADLHRTVDLLGKQNYPPAKNFAAAARRLVTR
ncbi:MAG: helix-turn-helix domain-containing protein [Pseudonocardiaceae bacterium]